MTFEFTDPVKGLEQLLDITRALQKWEHIDQTCRSQESIEKLKFWRQVRDNFINKHKITTDASHK